jgi:folate-binding protein YgfZ
VREVPHPCDRTASDRSAARTTPGYARDVSATPAPSPLLTLPDAVAGDGIDAPVAAHYGSFNREQRVLESGEGFVDLSHRDVVRVSGPDRLAWLHSLTSQHLESLAPKVPTAALVLSPQGHVEYALYGVDDGEAFTAHVEPGQAPALVEWLDRMRFMMRVEVTDVTADVAVAWRPAARIDGAPYSGYMLVPRADLETFAEAAGPACGMWAFEALRIARGEPRHGLDTDHRTIPNEAGWIGTAVHLEKGCYRGQETVARVHTLGRPPRRLTLLHLDGSDSRLPVRGAELLNDAGKSVGFVGTSARHHELGPVALAMVKRNTPLDAPLDADGVPASQEVVVDPDAGLHVRPNLR